MNLHIFIPFFALAVWLSAMYVENKMRHFYPDRNILLKNYNNFGWRSFIIRKNVEIKYIGLFLLWLGISLGLVLSDRQVTSVSYVFYGISAIGLSLYVTSRIWPFLFRR